jgi:hypothetical protein
VESARPVNVADPVRRTLWRRVLQWLRNLRRPVDAEEVERALDESEPNYPPTPEEQQRVDQAVKAGLDRTRNRPSSPEGGQRPPS